MVHVMGKPYSSDDGETLLRLNEAAPSPDPPPAAGAADAMPAAGTAATPARSFGAGSGDAGPVSSAPRPASHPPIDGLPLAPAQLREGIVPTALVPGPVRYRLLQPFAPAAQPLPLLLCLHGGIGGHDVLGLLAPTVQTMWRAGTLPPMVLAAPETGHSLYLDFRDGSQKWETFLTTTLLNHLRETCPLSAARANTWVCGVSMGGLGALRLGLKHPNLFGGVVAWEPSIEPAFSWPDVKMEDRFWRPPEMLQARYGDPIDEAFWAANNPATIAMFHAGAIRASGLRLYFEVGGDDVYGLYRGAEFLHRTLFDHTVPHEFRLVLGADHVGPSLPHRLQDGLDFIARALAPQPADQRVAQLRALVGLQRRRAGLAG